MIKNGIFSNINKAKKARIAGGCCDLKKESILKTPTYFINIERVQIEDFVFAR